VVALNPKLPVAKARTLLLGGAPGVSLFLTEVMLLPNSTDKDGDVS
jgi:hypothetical protein